MILVATGDGDARLVTRQQATQLIDRRYAVAAVGDDDVAVLPAEFQLRQNYPNPFNPTTNILYSLPVKADVTIVIYNVLGRTVKVFEQGEQSAGEYSVRWDATDNQGRAVTSGMYFYSVSAGKFSATRKMMLLK